MMDCDESSEVCNNSLIDQLFYSLLLLLLLLPKKAFLGSLTNFHSLSLSFFFIVLFSMTDFTNSRSSAALDWCTSGSTHFQLSTPSILDTDESP
jgi:hypothetical protein